MAISLYEGSVASYLQTLAVQARLASVAPIASPCEGPLANIRAAFGAACRLKIGEHQALVLWTFCSPPFTQSESV
jgi:hypothetical protein